MKESILKFFGYSVYRMYLRLLIRYHEWRVRKDERLRTREDLHLRHVFGDVLDKQDRQRATYQAQCNHKKGGFIQWNVPQAVVAQELLKGNASQYAVRKHQIMNGDLWVDCLRCGKKWRPPLRSDFSDERTFYRAVEEYETAKDFPTNNATSGSLLFSFYDKETGRDASEQITKMYAKIGG